MADLSLHANDAIVRANHPGDHLDQGGLPRTVVANERHDFSCSEGHRHSEECFDGTEAFVNA